MGPARDSPPGPHARLPYAFPRFISDEAPVPGEKQCQILERCGAERSLEGTQAVEIAEAKTVVGRFKVWLGQERPLRWMIQWAGRFWRERVALQFSDFRSEEAALYRSVREGDKAIYAGLPISEAPMKLCRHHGTSRMDDTFAKPARIFISMLPIWTQDDLRKSNLMSVAAAAQNIRSQSCGRNDSAQQQPRGTVRETTRWRGDNDDEDDDDDDIDGSSRGGRGVGHGEHRL